MSSPILLKKGALVATVLLAVGSAGALAQSTELTRADRKFMEEAAGGGLTEVELGNLAQQRASSDQVKQFGARMAQDHARANDELKTIALSKNVTVSASLPKSGQKDVDRLSKLSGADFDREYMKHMLADHKKDVSAFQKEAKSGKDTEVKGFAARTLPTVQEHLQLAQSVNDAVKSTKS